MSGISKCWKWWAMILMRMFSTHWKGLDFIGKQYKMTTFQIPSLERLYIYLYIHLYDDSKDSWIKSSDIRTKIESEHFQSDIILVRGLRIGYVEINVSLNEKGYEHVSDVVSLIIIERFPRTISTFYILPKTTVNFDLAIITLIRNDNHLMILESNFLNCVKF